MTIITHPIVSTTSAMDTLHSAQPLTGPQNNPVSNNSVLLMGDFFPSSATQLWDYLGTSKAAVMRVLSPCSWIRFANQQKSKLTTLWHSGHPVPLTTKLAQWPQSSRIHEYFGQTPTGMAMSFSNFTWQFVPFLTVTNLSLWELALGMHGCAKYMDTILCPPCCPLCHHSHSCGHDVAMISTSHSQPSGYILIHWAWDFLSFWDRAAVCSIKLPTLSSPGTSRLPHKLAVNVFHSYAHLHAMACSSSIRYLWQPCTPTTPLPLHVDTRCKYDNGIALL